jgi:tripartite-type tricarboxylate transporter receptor subunit TctC
MMQFTRKTIAVALGISATGAMMVPGMAGADAVSDHFKNKTMTVLIPYGPGGTYDKYGQTFTKYMDKFIPGKPNMIVQHMPGAGGAKAMNYAYNVMSKNGLNMIVPLDNTVINQLLRPEKMRYQSDKFIWVGSTNQTNVILVASTKKGVLTLEDWQKSAVGLIGSSSGAASTSTLIPKYLMSALKLKGKVVSGYKGSSASIFAIERGEADMSAFNWLAWSSKVPHWFTGDKPFAKPLLQVGVWKDPDLKDVPMLEDIVPAEYKAGAKFLGTLGPLGRGLALPPGVPNMVIEPLRTAYDKMNADPIFAAELKKRKLRLIPSKGADIQKTVEDAMKSTTPEVIAFVREAIFPKKK